LRRAGWRVAVVDTPPVTLADVATAWAWLGEGASGQQARSAAAEAESGATRGVVDEAMRGAVAS